MKSFPSLVYVTVSDDNGRRSSPLSPDIIGQYVPVSVSACVCVPRVTHMDTKPTDTTTITAATHTHTHTLRRVGTDGWAQHAYGQ